MFLNKSNFNYNIDLHTSDISLHNGVPKNFSHLKDNDFGPPAVHGPPDGFPAQLASTVFWLRAELAG